MSEVNFEYNNLSLKGEKLLFRKPIFKVKVNPIKRSFQCPLEANGGGE